MAGQAFQCGCAQVEFLQETTVQGTTCTKQESLGRALRFRVSLRNRMHLETAYVCWHTGERDVRCLDAQNASQALRRLEHGLRLGVHTTLLGEAAVPAGHVAMELRQARVRVSALQPWSNLFKATLDELSEGAGVDVEAVLKGIAGVHLGTRWALLHDDGPRADFLCMLARDTDGWSPVLAYVLTRVLPIARNYTHFD